MIKKFHANQARLRRHRRLRNTLEGSPARPRLNVFRSGQHIYAQVIDDSTGRTLVSASSLDESLKDFKPAVAVVKAKEERAEVAEVAAEAAPSRGRGARAEKAAPKAQQGGKAPAKGAQQQKGRPTQVKTVLPSAQKGERKTPVEALAAIANNRKVAIAREVGKLVGQRAKERGVVSVVFDRGGYTYHGRVAALAEGAREAGLKF
jgi:ribosomal protein L18